MGMNWISLVEIKFHHSKHRLIYSINKGIKFLNGNVNQVATADEAAYALQNNFLKVNEVAFA